MFPGFFGVGLVDFLVTTPSKETRSRQGAIPKSSAVRSWIWSLPVDRSPKWPPIWASATRRFTSGASRN